MSKIRIIVIDALILFAVSTAFVILADQAFSGLKGKTPKDDPLVSAIQQEDLKLLESKLGDGSKPDALFDEHGRSALMRAAYLNVSDADLAAKSDEKRAPMISLLIQRGAKPDHLDKDGWSALMWSAWSGLPKVAEQLLENQASTAPTDKHGYTALALAARRGNVKVVRLLLDHGAQGSPIDQAKAGMAEYPDKAADYKEIISQLSAK